MKTLEDIGLIESYAERSNLGLLIESIIDLILHLVLPFVFLRTPSLENHKIEQYRHEESGKFYKEYDFLAQIMMEKH